ncbi:MAG: VWA domain-containing protein [Spirochaetales bacterium]|nr:VWA domain-containing protein [Spirochaetales bacterium]
MRINCMQKLLLSVLMLIMGSAMSSAFADGFIVIPEPVTVSGRATPFPLAVKYHTVEVNINGQTATTSIDQIFYNPSDRRMEGEYIFPIPRGAVIKNFSMFIDGKETRAEMLDAAKARQIYEEIVRKALDPALLEYHDSNIFRVRIFPIEPKSEKRIKITYTEILFKNKQTYEYLYPLNTEKFSSQPLESASVKVTINTTQKIKNAFSTTHPVHVIRKSDTQLVASWEEENVTPSTDFKLYFSLDASEFGLTLLTHKPDAGDGFFLLDISPGFWNQSRETNPKDIIFVLDTSGSMKGDKLLKAGEALKYCIDRLNPLDGFQIIRFSTEAEPFFAGVVDASEANKVSAKKYIDTLQPIGGTNIEDALIQALGQTRLTRAAAAPGADGTLEMVVFITDGKPTIGEIQTDKLAPIVKNANKRNRRIFTLGIDFSLNTLLLDRITAESRAYRTYITPSEDISEKITDFFQKVERPVLTDIRITHNSTIRWSKTQPDSDKLPDMFYGMSMVVLGRYAGSGDTSVTLSGTLSGKPVSYTYSLSFPATLTANETIAPLWAARRVGYLLDLVRISGSSQEIIDEITSLARAYGIITPYTSYLIIEDEHERVTQNRLPADSQTLGKIAEKDADFTARSKKEFENFKQDSGSEGVTASEETQMLNNSSSVKDINRGSERLFAPAAPEIQEQKMKNMVQNAGGRAFYNAGDKWIDSQVQDKPDRKIKRIQFASKEYFELINNEPATNKYLALGRNIQFVHNEILFDIYE